MSRGRAIARDMSRQACLTSGSLAGEKRNFLCEKGEERGAKYKRYVWMRVYYLLGALSGCVCGLYFPTVHPLGKLWREIHSALHLLF